MKKQDYFTNLFASAIDWKKVEENADAIAAILDKDKAPDDNDDAGEYIPLF